MTSGTPRYPLGVLFVHGIGFQGQGDTLVSNGEAFVAAMDGWMRRSEPGPHRRPRAAIRSADLRRGASQSGQPAAAEVTVEPVGSGAAETWLMAESWWSQAFAEPTFGDLARWALLVAPVTFAIHSQRRIRHALTQLTVGATRDYERRYYPPGKPAKNFGGRATSLVIGLVLSWKRILTLLIEALLFVIAMFLVPVLLALMVALLIVGLIPIGRVRSAVRSVQRKLTGSVGDSFVLLHSPMQGAAIVSQVRRDYDWLHGQCDKVAVVAHSQGAAIAHMMLRALPDRDAPDLFVSLGSGLKKLTEMRETRSQGEKPARKAALLLAGLLALSAGMVMLYPLFLPSAPDNSTAPPRVVAALVVTVLMIFLWSVTTRPLMIEQRAFGALWAGGMLLVAAVTPLALEARDWDAGWVTFGGLALTMMAIGLLRPPDTIDRSDYQLAAGTTWLDVYSTHDPVPNGSLLDRPEDSGLLESREVANRWSIVSDHTTYWQNPESFVVPLVRAVAEVAGVRLASPEVEDADRACIAVANYRRRWRLRSLGQVRLLAIVSVVPVLVAGWRHHWPSLGEEIWGELVPVLNRIPGVELSGGMSLAWQRTIGGTVGVLMIVAGYHLVYLVWSRWERADVRRFFGRAGFRIAEPWSVAFFAAVAVGAMAVAYLTVAVTAAVDGVGALVAPALVAAGTAVVFVFFTAQKYWVRWTRSGTPRKVLGIRAGFLNGQLWAISQLQTTAHLRDLPADPARWLTQRVLGPRLEWAGMLWSLEGMEIVECIDAEGLEPGAGPPADLSDEELAALDGHLTEIVNKAADRFGLQAARRNPRLIRSEQDDLDIAIELPEPAPVVD